MRAASLMVVFALAGVCSRSPGQDDPHAASAPAKLRASDLTASTRVELKLEQGEGGILKVTDAELAPSGDRDSLLGPVEEIHEDEVVALGVPVALDGETSWLNEANEAIDRKVVMAGSLVKIDFQRGEIRAKRVRLLEGARRWTLTAAIEKVRDTAAGDRALTVLGREVFVATRLKVSRPDGLELSGAQGAVPSRPAGTPAKRQGIRKDEDVTRAIVKLGDWGTIGGTTEWRYESRENHTLDENRDRDEWRSRLRFRVELTARPTDDLLIVAGLRGEQEDREVHERDDLHAFIARPDETFIQGSNLLADGLSLLVGRSRFEDDREWLFNRNLDGARLFYDQGALSLEGSITKAWSTGNLNDHHTLNLMGIATLDVGAKSTITGYVIDRRDDRRGDQSPFLYGLRSSGKPLKGLSHWLELAGASGTDGRNRIRGYAADVGATYTAPLPLKPSLTLGYAFASGDSHPNDGVDRTFRQTGLQRNAGKLSGVTSLRYYGELFDPELSNLHILTVGAGARLANRTSIDLLWHSYAQDEAVASLRNANLRATPNGRFRELGWGADLVFGMRELEQADFEVVFGWFEPGRAFDTNQSALTAKFQVRFKF